jgi:hypothetical protein
MKMCIGGHIRDDQEREPTEQMVRVLENKKQAQDREEHH